MRFINFNPETDEVTFCNTWNYNRHSLIPEDKITMQVINYFLDTFNYHDISGQIVKAFNYWIQAPEDILEEHHARFKIVTAGYLLNQDVCDNRKLRQNKPTAHVIYSVPRTLSATIISTVAPSWVDTKFLHKQAQLTVTNTQATAIRRNIEIELATRVVCPDERLYYELCGTRGTLTALLEELQSLQELHGTKMIDFVKLANHIRIFLTIVDECRHVAVNDIQDIDAHHFSFPMVYAARNNSKEGDLILTVMRQGTKNKVVLSHVLSALKNTDCFVYTKVQLGLLKEEILREYEKFDKNPFMEDIFSRYLQIPENFEDISWELS